MGGGGAGVIARLILRNAQEIVEKHEIVIIEK